MNPKDVRLPLRVCIRPAIELIKTQPFIWTICGIVLLFSWFFYTASFMPVLASNAAIDAILSFGLSVALHIFALLPFILVTAWIFTDETDGCRDMYNDFKAEKERLFLPLQKEALEQAEQDLLG